MVFTTDATLLHVQMYGVNDRCSPSPCTNVWCERPVQPFPMYKCVFMVFTTERQGWHRQHGRSPYTCARVGKCPEQTKSPTSHQSVYIIGIYRTGCAYAFICCSSSCCRCWRTTWIQGWLRGWVYQIKATHLHVYCMVFTTPKTGRAGTCLDTGLVSEHGISDQGHSSPCILHGVYYAKDGESRDLPQTAAAAGSTAPSRRPAPHHPAQLNQ